MKKRTDWGEWGVLEGKKRTIRVDLRPKFMAILNGVIPPFIFSITPLTVPSPKNYITRPNRIIFLHQKISIHNLQFFFLPSHHVACDSLMFISNLHMDLHAFDPSSHALRSQNHIKGLTSPGAGITQILIFEMESPADIDRELQVIKFLAGLGGRILEAESMWHGFPFFWGARRKRSTLFSSQWTSKTLATPETPLPLTGKAMAGPEVPLMFPRSESDEQWV